MKRSILLIIIAIFQIHCFAQHNKVDSVWCDSVVKANSIYTHYQYSSEYYKKGNLLSEGYRLMVDSNSQHGRDVGKCVSYHRNGNLCYVFYLDINGHRVDTSTMFRTNGDLNCTMIFDSVNTYTYRGIADRASPDNYYMIQYRKGNRKKMEGRLFEKGNSFRRERRGKWIFYRRNGEIRKVKFF